MSTHHFCSYTSETRERPLSGREHVYGASDMQEPELKGR